MPIWSMCWWTSVVWLTIPRVRLGHTAHWTMGWWTSVLSDWPHPGLGQVRAHGTLNHGLVDFCSVWLTIPITNGSKNPVKKRPHFAEQPARHHKWVQKSCDKPSRFCFRTGWTWCQRAFWGGWTSCHMWQTVHLEAGVDELYLDESYSCKNVTGANCNSRYSLGGWIVWV